MMMVIILKHMLTECLLNIVHPNQKELTVIVELDSAEIRL